MRDLGFASIQVQQFYFLPSVSLFISNFMQKWAPGLNESGQPCYPDLNGTKLNPISGFFWIWGTSHSYCDLTDKRQATAAILRLRHCTFSIMLTDLMRLQTFEVQKNRTQTWYYISGVKFWRRSLNNLWTSLEDKYCDQIWNATIEDISKLLHYQHYPMQPWRTSSNHCRKPVSDHHLVKTVLGLVNESFSLRSCLSPPGFILPN